MSTSFSTSARANHRLQAVLAHSNRYAFDGASRLARDVGVTPSAISRILSGQRHPSFGLMMAITETLEKELGRTLDPTRADDLLRRLSHRKRLRPLRLQGMRLLDKRHSGGVMNYPADLYNSKPSSAISRFHAYEQCLNELLTKMGYERCCPLRQNQNPAAHDARRQGHGSVGPNRRHRRPHYLAG